MTANHLLLYRLAELMLEHEQHILPVDLLFDDEQIGDFVKSIQIDSPYQQMLLEGVLTESVRDEKLYVSFTVERYFHFVLGEVIYNKNIGHGAEELKQIVENNKLNGAKEGVELCLIRDVEKNKLTRLMWLIDQGGANLNLCIVPLAHAFMQMNENPKTDKEVRLSYQTRIKVIIDRLLEESTDNDINAIEKSLSYLEKNEKIDIVSIVFQQINNSILLKNLKSATLYLKSLDYISESELKGKIRILETLYFENINSVSYAIYLRILGGIYSTKKSIVDYKKAIHLIHQSLDIYLEKYPKYYMPVYVNYGMLGLTYMLNGEFDKSIEYYSKSLIILEENKNEDVSSILECFGIVELKRKNYKKAMDYFVRTLKIKELKLGYYHSNVASTLQAIALTYSEIGDSLNAVKNWSRALEIEKRLNKHNWQSLAILHKKIGDEYLRMLNYKLSITHLLIFWNYLKSNDKREAAIKIVTEKILKCYNSIGLEKYKTRNYSESVIAYNSALNVIKESKIGESKMDHVIYFNLGNAYFKNGQLNEAKSCLDLALKIRIRSVDKNPTLVGKTYNSLGNVELSKGNFKNAKEHYQKAYAIFLGVLGIDHEHTKLLSNKINDL